MFGAVCAAEPPGDRYSRLVDRARAEGKVRVIVVLKAGTNGESRTDGETASAVKKLQDKLVRRMAAFNATEVKTFKTMPAVAMQVDEAGLKDLMANSDVERVEPDEPVPPTR
jgi:hypothetical protein